MYYFCWIKVIHTKIGIYLLETSFYEEDLKVKSMKQLVLVGLVLLASVMVLAGCDTNAGGSAEIINSEIG